MDMIGTDGYGPGTLAAIQVELAMGVWRVLYSDGPLHHILGNGQVYGDMDPTAPMPFPSVWVDPLASGCYAAGPAGRRTFHMVVCGQSTTKREALLIMNSILGALADARPDEYLKAEGFEVKQGMGASGTVTPCDPYSLVDGPKEPHYCVLVTGVITVGPVGSSH